MQPLTELLGEAIDEIRRLRRQNELLSAKVEVMDVFACVLHTEPARRSGGMAPDIVYGLEQKIEELRQQEQRKG
ncbi:MAG: hypothetical protein MI806_25945 [Minwuiales bacterium]|nr:hypothetical protein [Minwuiales bacterium]